MSFLRYPVADPTVFPDSLVASDSAPQLKDIRNIAGVAGLRRGIFLSWVRRLVLLFADACSIGLAWLLSHGLGAPSQLVENVESVEITLVLTVVISLSLFFARNLYRSGESRRDYLGVTKALSLSALLLLLISYFYGPNHFISRSQFLYFWGFSILFVCSSRFLIDSLTYALRLRGSICHPVMVIADDGCSNQAVGIVKSEQRYMVASLVDASALDRANRDHTFAKIQRLGITEVFVAWDAIKNRMFLGQRFQALGLTLRVIPVEQDQVLGGANIHTLKGHIPCVSFCPAVIAGVDFWIKRLFDVTFALGFLILFAPVYLAIAIAIRIDSSGPIFYQQTRIGLHGNPFKVWKFRSMVQDADKLQAKLETMNQTKDGVLFKIKADPRITRVGNFIRRYSLDELPQIFNVLLGEMSLVGPRPLPLRDVEKFEQHYFIRQDVLPGITGMWQVSGRSDIDNFDDVLKLDLFYIQNWSIWLDISILFRTFAAVLQKSGAY